MNGTGIFLCSITIITSFSVFGQQRDIIFILTDDQRFDALGVVNPWFQTPHLDALARNGILFENAFVTTSLCSPSRATFLTGQWAHRHQVLNNSTRLDPDIPTFPKQLQKAGYETGFAGKWHMGGSSDDPRPGFDYWASFRGQGAYMNQTFNIDGERVPKQGHTSDVITDLAVEFLERDRDKPFFLYVSHKAVHAMFTPAERHRGTYADTEYPYPESMADTDENYAGKPDWVRAQRNSWHGVDGMYNNRMDLDTFTRQYAETLMSVDDSVGRIVETLRQLGKLDDTLIVFTSDNGFQFGEHGLIDKRTMYEASIRVPLIAHCPVLFEAGQRRTQLVANADFAPTFLDAADATIPDTVQGRSFWDVLNDPDATGREVLLYTYFWERSFPQTPTVLGVHTGRYKYMQYQGMWSRNELYDLENDPHERNNLIGDYYTRTEAGAVESRLRDPRIDEDIRNVVQDMQAKLRGELETLGCAPEPNWLPITDPRRN